MYATAHTLFPSSRLVVCACGLSGGGWSVDQDRVQSSVIGCKCQWGAESWESNYFPCNMCGYTLQWGKKERFSTLAGVGSECLTKSLCLGHWWMPEVAMRGLIYSPSVEGSGAMKGHVLPVPSKYFKYFVTEVTDTQSRGLQCCGRGYIMWATLFWRTCQESVSE